MNKTLRTKYWIMSFTVVSWEKIIKLEYYFSRREYVRQGVWNSHQTFDWVDNHGIQMIVNQFCCALPTSLGFLKWVYQLFTPTWKISQLTCFSWLLQPQSSYAICLNLLKSTKRLSTMTYFFIEHKNSHRLGDTETRNRSWPETEKRRWSHQSRRSWQCWN